MMYQTVVRVIVSRENKMNFDLVFHRFMTILNNINEYFHSDVKM